MRDARTTNHQKREVCLRTYKTIAASARFLASRSRGPGFLFVRCAAPAEKGGLILQMDSTECGFYCEFDESAASLLSLTKVNFLPTFGRVLIFQNAKKAKTGCWADSPDFSFKGISMCSFHNFNKNMNFYLLCLPVYAKINAIRPIGELLISLFKTL